VGSDGDSEAGISQGFLHARHVVLVEEVIYQPVSVDRDVHRHYGVRGGCVGGYVGKGCSGASFSPSRFGEGGSRRGGDIGLWVDGGWL
jgi:hypothetical protein